MVGAACAKLGAMPRASTTELEILVSGITEREACVDVSQLIKFTEVIGRIFSVKPDEVAILTIVSGGKFLKFRVPDKLQGVGQIPLSSNSALAARTAREKKAEIFNHFSVVPHASVFEAVRLKEEAGDPIQKILSAPIIFKEKVLGVIQISRKAKSAKYAPDFSPQDLQQLIAVAALLAPAMRLCEV